MKSLAAIFTLYFFYDIMSYARFIFKMLKHIWKSMKISCYLARIIIFSINVYTISIMKKYILQTSKTHPKTHKWMLFTSLNTYTSSQKYYWQKRYFYLWKLHNILTMSGFWNHVFHISLQFPTKFTSDLLKHIHIFQPYIIFVNFMKIW